MANRVKEDEKNEKIIRGLMKLPANRRCINCNNLGPQYVCTNFSTFICTNCSGVHREFTHRVKSVSMAKFTSQEVSALQEGGNERAREIFFKELDPQRNQFPDSSNIDKLRDFIKHAYEERRFTGERRVPMAKSYNEETSDSRRTDSYRGGSRSPPYAERYNESPGYNSSRSSNDGRNPRYSYGERSPTDYRRSPQQRPDEKRAVSERMKPQGGSPSPNYYQSDGSNTQVVVQPVRDYYRRDEGSSPQVVVRPVRDILGDDAPPLRIGEPPKPNGSVKAPLPPISPPPAQVERTSSASSIASVRHEPSSTMQPTVQPSVQPTKEPPTPAPAPEPIMSLIDFSADPEPPISSPPAPAQQTNSPQTNNTNNSDSSGWAAFDAFATQQPRSQSQNPASQFQNPLDSALAQLSLSGSPVAPVDASPKSLEASLFDAPPPSVAPPTNQPEQSLFGAPAPTNQQESLPQPAIPTNVQPQQLNAPTTEAKPSGRKELPQDFFTSLYPPAAQQMPGWPRGPQYSMGYAMQYPAAMVMPTYPQAQPQPVKSANPFDIGNDPAPVQAPTYPTMAPPNMHMNMMNMGAQQGLMRPSSLEGTSPRWMAPPSQYMMQQMPGTIPQQMPNNMFPIMQQGGLGQVNTGFGGMPDPNTQGRYSQPNTPNNFFGTVGGNPFG